MATGRERGITGAASGLDAAAARRFATEGARVAGLDLARPDWWIEVESVAPGASFAVVDVTDDASFVTGHALVIDGGFTAGMRTGRSDLFGTG